MKRYLPFIAGLALMMATGGCNKTEQVANNVPDLHAGNNGYYTAAVSEKSSGKSTGHIIAKPLGGNPTSNAGPILGNVLFFETQFTINNKLSCGSCHQPGKPLSNVADLISKPAAGSEAIVNCSGTSDLEMADNLVLKLNSMSKYPALFQAAFGSPEITAERIRAALAQYINVRNAQVTAAINKAGVTEIYK